jgi:ribonuclease D
VAALAQGQGPVAADSERASSYRYSDDAQLVQLFRRGSGIFLIDSAALGDLSTVSQALRGVEWVFHAASQDLPCLRRCGLQPDSIFDTELASRLLGEPHVGLAAVVARTVGVGLAKQHSAQDWSRRPLPTEWLNYAALDVAFLLDVRDVLETELAAADKLEIARQEAAAVLAAPPPAPRPEPWRRVNGSHSLRSPRQLAVVRSLWQARDRIAARRDLFPGRVLPDAAIVAAAAALPSKAEELALIHPFNGPRQSRQLGYWWQAVAEALALRPSELPSLRGPRRETTPPVRYWAKRNPSAAERMAMVKPALAQLSEELRIPVENLMQPDLIRQMVFNAPNDIPAVMAAEGARPWQIKAVGPLIQQAVAAYPAVTEAALKLPPLGST